MGAATPRRAGKSRLVAKGGKIRVQRRNPFVIRCVSCSCTDIQACDNGFGDPCHWISVNATRRLGVCSECAIRMCNALLFPEPSDAEINREIMAAARS